MTTVSQPMSICGVFLRFGHQHNWGELKLDKQGSIIRIKAGGFLKNPNDGSLTN